MDIQTHDPIHRGLGSGLCSSDNVPTWSTLIHVTMPNLLRGTNLYRDTWLHPDPAMTYSEEELIAASDADMSRPAMRFMLDGR